MISETKIDDSFPFGQFAVEEFCNSKGGGILLYVREGILSSLIKVDLNQIENVELILRNN